MYEHWVECVGRVMEWCWRFLGKHMDTVIPGYATERQFLDGRPCRGLHASLPARHLKCALRARISLIPNSFKAFGIRSLRCRSGPASHTIQVRTRLTLNAGQNQDLSSDQGAVV